MRILHLSKENKRRIDSPKLLVLCSLSQCEVYTLPMVFM